MTNPSLPCSEPDQRDLSVLVLAPTGRDASLLCTLLASQDLTAKSVSAAEAVDLLRRQQGGMLLAAEEALSEMVVRALAEAAAAQPTWADFPIMVLTASGKGAKAGPRLREGANTQLNHTLLERPVRPETLVAGVRSALRARSRQYDVRATIEDLRQASLALQESEERNRLILQSTRDCIKLLDLQGRLLTMNAEGQERFAIADFSLVRDRSWFDFWLPPYRQLAVAALAEAVDGGAGRFEGEFRRADGEFSWWDVSVTPVRSPDGSLMHLLVVSRETTARKRAERALIESEKLAAVGRLAASISHEINNPLEAVTNLIYIVSGDSSLSPETRAYLAMADRELARVSQIAGQTLRFHRQATRPRSLTTRELLDPVLALYQGRLLNSGISIDLEVRDLDELTCYEGEIRQVLNNLVGNAVDAMRASGGRLRIRAQSARDWVHDRLGARITIADTGHGMPPEVANRIFDAFYTTKGINGNGLGLWISQGIVEKHHGRLRVRSRCNTRVRELQAAGTEPGLGDKAAPSGTVFSLFLPAQLSEVA